MVATRFHMAYGIFECVAIHKRNALYYTHEKRSVISFYNDSDEMVAAVIMMVVLYTSNDGRLIAIRVHKNNAIIIYDDELCGGRDSFALKTYHKLHNYSTAAL